MRIVESMGGRVVIYFKKFKKSRKLIYISALRFIRSFVSLKIEKSELDRIVAVATLSFED